MFIIFLSPRGVQWVGAEGTEPFPCTFVSFNVLYFKERCKVTLS